MFLTSFYSKASCNDENNCFNSYQQYSLKNASLFLQNNEFAKIVNFDFIILFFVAQPRSQALLFLLRLIYQVL